MCSYAAFNERSSSTETDHPAPVRCWNALRPLLSVQFFVQPCPVLLGVFVLCLPFLVATEGFYVVSGRVRKRELPLVLAFGIAATLISTLFNTTLTTVGPCALGVSGSGFPLPWYLTV